MGSSDWRGENEKPGADVYMVVDEGMDNSFQIPFI